MKKITAIIISICILAGCMPIAFAQGGSWTEVTTPDWVDNLDAIKWQIDENGTLTMEEWSSLVTHPHTWHYYGPWYKNTSIKKVIFPDSVTYIGELAFGDCTSLEEVLLPENLESFSPDVFRGCANLSLIKISENNKSFTVSDNVLFDKTMETLIFYPQGKEGEEYTIPETVKTIGEKSLASSKIKRLTIPKSVTKIADYSIPKVDAVYYNGTSSDWAKVQFGQQNFLLEADFYVLKEGTDEYELLDKSVYDNYVFEHIENGLEIIKYKGNEEHITVPDNVEGIPVVKIHDDAFRYNAAKSIVIPNTVTEMGKYVFTSCSNLEKVTLPENITQLGDWTFYCCESLKEITLPESIKTIGEQAFYECKSLTEITLPENVEAIGQNAFRACFNLERINVDKDNKFFTSDWQGILYNYDMTKLIACPSGKTGEVKIHYGTKTIGKNAFNFTKAEYIRIPYSVEKIESCAFENCHNLKTIVVPGSVTSIDRRAFSDIAAENMILEENISSISYYAFPLSEIKNLTVYNPDFKIVAEDGNTSGKFFDLAHFENMYAFPGGDVEAYCTKKKVNFIPLKEGDWEKYLSENTKDEMHEVKVEDNKTFDFGLYEKHTAKIVAEEEGKVINTVTDKWTVDKIIEGMSNVEVVEGTDAGTAEEEWIIKVFLYPEEESSLKDEFLVIEKTNLGNMRIRIRRYNKENVLLEEKYYTEPTYRLGSFMKEAVVKPIYMSGSYNNITWNLSKEGILTLSGTGTTERDVDDNVWVSTWVKELVIEEGITEAEGFGWHENLEKITLPSSLETIGTLAFYHNNKLEKVVLPENVKQIGIMAFIECENLKEVVVTSKVPVKIERSAFYVGEGARVYLPETVYWIDGCAFSYTWAVMGGYGTGPLVKNLTIITPYGCPAYTWATEKGINVETNEPNDEIPVKVNGDILQCDSPPYIKNDRTMVPMRVIFEALGACVTWDDITKTAIGVKDGVEVKITIGENVLYKNGEAIMLDAVAEITKDRTMVPVRAISEAFGSYVNWKDDTKTVEIATTKEE